jgi:hypothetical protein
MTEYHDHYDDEGYRAFLTSRDEAVLAEFVAWLDGNGIAHARDPGEDTIWTVWIPNKAKAALLKLTWSGSL